MFFAFWMPLTQRLERRHGAAAAMAAAAVALLVVPLVHRAARRRGAGRRRRSTKTSASAACSARSTAPTARSRCSRATSRRSDLVARVDPALCVSCGICAGSCAPMGVGPAGPDGPRSDRAVRAFLAAAERRAGRDRRRSAASTAPGRLPPTLAAEGGVPYPGRLRRQPAHVGHRDAAARWGRRRAGAGVSAARLLEPRGAALARRARAPTARSRAPGARRSRARPDRARERAANEARGIDAAARVCGRRRRAGPAGGRRRGRGGTSSANRRSREGRMTPPRSRRSGSRSPSRRWLESCGRSNVRMSAHGSADGRASPGLERPPRAHRDVPAAERGGTGQAAAAHAPGARLRGHDRGVSARGAASTARSSPTASCTAAACGRTVRSTCSRSSCCRPPRRRWT